MTKHEQFEAASLNRRHFLVGTAATGLVLGYAAVPELGEALGAAEAPASFEP
ncbi:MAG TPA: twin-arginine translocation signal domain-containing protein, partial [Xanthobacteraceae bacterium]|nr:twin-arginine translocation signal domain-containing protein [Xanthobacteraceae bacterium]